MFQKIFAFEHLKEDVYKARQEKASLFSLANVTGISHVESTIKVKSRNNFFTLQKSKSTFVNVPFTFRYKSSKKDGIRGS